MEENTVKDEVQIAEEVVASIAGMAIKDLKGVVKLAGGFTEEISEAFGKKNLGKGIRVDIKENAVRLEVSIVVQYGVKIPEIAKKIQEKIKNDVENMTGYKINKIIVKVQGIEKKEEMQ